jgi:hypothetical protein
MNECITHDHITHDHIFDIIDGSLITKDKRNELFGSCDKGAGTSKPEHFQRQTISTLTKVPCLKTNVRINLRTNSLQELCYPNKSINGFDYSENFDGIQTIKDKTIYINLKCIVGTGGSQTRSLREVYWFVQGQLNVLLNCSTSISSLTSSNIYFANIMDGDEASSSFSKFSYLLDLPIYSSIKHKIYVGDLKHYFDWFKSI